MDLALEAALRCSTEPPGGDIGGFLDMLYVEMNKLEMRHISIDLDQAAGTVWVACTMDVEDESDGLFEAHTALRTALHAAGGFTPDWPSPLEVDKVERGSFPGMENTRGSGLVHA